MKLMAVYNAVKKLIGPNWYCFILPYRWEYAKIAWLTRGSAWPRHSSGAVLPGRSGWLIAWISFVLLSPEGWYGFPAESWREIRTLCRDVNFKASPYYGHVNESPRIISGWSAAWEMLRGRLSNKYRQRATEFLTKLGSESSPDIDD